MKRSIITAITAAIFCMGFSSAGAAEDEICLGYSLPLTGEHAQYGEVFRNSAKLRLAEFNNSGVIPVKVEIKYEDSKSDPKEARNIATKFLDDKCIVGVLGDFTSTVSMAAGRVYAKGKMPQLSQTASHPDYTKVSDYQFRNITTQAFEGPFVANWADEMGFKTFAIISIQNDWGISAAENFAEAVKANGGKVTSLEYFNPGTRDYRAILTKISRDNPDVIYAGMMYEEGAMLMQQVKQLGIKSTIFATSSVYSPKTLELAGDAANGLYLSTTFMPTSPEPQVKHFVQQYEQTYGSSPNMFAAQAYDAVGIMLEAVARAYKKDPNVTRAMVRDELAATKGFSGVTGETTFDPVTREPVKSLARMQVREVQFELLQ
ncbi:MAG: ABC transporter substrate-binding protein [Desulforhopalus sp.]